jgi:hypothetical protein
MYFFRTSALPYEATHIPDGNKAYQPDFICFNEIIIEIKAISKLSGVNFAGRS